MDAWWRAANYLAVGQIYLTANPLLHSREDLEMVRQARTIMARKPR